MQACHCPVRLPPSRGSLWSRGPSQLPAGPGRGRLAGMPCPFAAELIGLRPCLAYRRSLRRHGLRAAPTDTGSDGLCPPPAWNPRPQPRRRFGQPGRLGRVLDQPDHTVLIAMAPVDNTRRILLDIVKKVKIVSDELHLEQRLINRDRPGVMELLPDYQGPVAFHLDRDNAVSHGVIVWLTLHQMLPAPGI